MPRTRTTVTIDDQVLTATRVLAARTGRADSDIVEEALRKMLGLDLLERIWAGADLGDDQAMDLALEAQRSVRGKRH